MYLFLVFRIGLKFPFITSCRPMHQKRLWVSIASRFLFSSNIRPDAKRFVKHEFQRFFGQHNIGIDLRENSGLSGCKHKDLNIGSNCYRSMIF